MTDPEVVCLERDRKCQHWTFRVGDVVAVKVMTGDAFAQAEFPFCVPWRPAQILAIYTEGNNACAGSEDLCLEFRWFYRLGERECVNIEGSGKGLLRIYSTE